MLRRLPTLSSKNQGSPNNEIDPRLRERHRALRWGRVLVCFAAMAVLAGAARSGQQPLPLPGSPDRLSTNSVVNRLPDANDQMRMREQQVQKQNVDAPNTEHERQVAADSANLLKLATELKAEVDKTNKDMLSVTVIRKADAIEKLARQVKEKMKRTAGAS